MHSATLFPRCCLPHPRRRALCKTRHYWTAALIPSILRRLTLKLQNCILDRGVIAMAPLRRKEPEKSWTRGLENGQIPHSLFDIYRRAEYLSFCSAPRFLKDDDNVLFSYFSLMLRSLAASLIDVDGDVKEFLGAIKDSYHPHKRLEDPSWNADKSEAAAKRGIKAFRALLMSIQACLDALSEIVAFFSQGDIKRLKVGRAQFVWIEEWLKDDYPLRLIATPRDIYLADLHAKLQPLVNCPPPECDWLPYMRMLRNKAAHF